MAEPDMASLGHRVLRELIRAPLTCGEVGRRTGIARERMYDACVWLEDQGWIRVVALPPPDLAWWAVRIAATPAGLAAAREATIR